MAWTALIIAGLLEAVWAAALKQSQNLTRPWPSVLTLAAMIASVSLLSLSLRSLTLGTAYTVWTGIGAVATFLVATLVLGEVASPLQISAAGLIVVGVALMKFATAP